MKVDRRTLDDLVRFARIERLAGDIEPWAAVLGEVRRSGLLDGEGSAWAVKVYNAYDDLGSAWRLIGRWPGPAEWAAERDTSAAAGWPVGHERRNLRGGLIRRHLYSYTAALGGQPQLRHLPEWETLRPLLMAVAAHLQAHVPDRYAAQLAEADRTDPAWVVPGTPFTTVTVNNTWPTGVHTDKGDLDAGFSTITCLRKGPYTGGHLVFPEYQLAADLHHGDLILMDAHEWHGNTQIVCGCGHRLNGGCPECGAERISLVTYFRTKLVRCGTPEEEKQRANEFHERQG